MDTCPEDVRSHVEASSPQTSLKEQQSAQLAQDGHGPSRPIDTGGPVFSGRNRYRNAALHWYRFGFMVIPIKPGTKHTVCKWDKWLPKLSRSLILQHWTEHPDHEVGFIVGDDYVVMDADSELAVRELYAIEQRYGMTPLLIAKTARGEHHTFKKDAALQCKTTSIVVGGDQDRIDFKTGRTLVVLPPSTNKSIIKMCGGEHA